MEMPGQSVQDSSETEPEWSDELQKCERNIPLSSFVLYKDRLSMLPSVTISTPPPLELVFPGRTTKEVDENSGLDEHLVSTVARQTGDKMSDDQKLNVSETVCQTLSASDSNLRTVKLQADGSTVKSASPKSADLLLLHRNVRSKAEHLGIMSMQYLPKRPLSQVCSGTFNRSIHDFAAASDVGHHSSNSSASDGQWRSAQSVSDQIQTARSFRQQRLHEPSAPQISETNRKMQKDPYGHVKDLSPYFNDSSFLLDAEASGCGLTDEHLIIQENLPKFLLASNDSDFRNSVPSVRSASSSRLSMIEEKQTVEVRKLKQELDLANEKIRSLTTQLDMNIVLVTSYGQNLESMTERHKHLMAVLDEKNAELQKLYSCVSGCDSCTENSKLIPPSSRNSMLERRRSSSISSFPTGLKLEETSLSLQVSSGSVGSLNSQSSSCSAASQPVTVTADNTLRRKSKKNWLKTSISRAFSGRKKQSPLLTVPIIANTHESSNSQLEFDVESCSTSVVHSPDPSKRTFCDAEEKDDCFLQKQLKEDRDMEIMDLKLEALSSAQKIEQLQETVVKLKRQVVALKAERMNADDVTADDRTANVNRGESSSAQSISFVNDHPRLLSQESFGVSSPKFLHKFSLQNSMHVVSVDDSYMSAAKPLNPATRRCTQYDRKKPVGAKLETSS